MSAYTGSLVVVFALLGAPAGALADTSAVTGDAVIAAVDRHEDGYRDIRSNVTMTLEDGRGERWVRRLDVYAIEASPHGDRRRFVFNRPRDVRGTAVLIHSNVVQDDDHWIYLPAFKRVKRISSTSKSTPFVGSEFSYEDLASQELEKYKNRHVGSAEVGGIDCDIVERIPTFPHSAYSRLLAYIDKADHRYRKVEYFDHKGEHVKTQYLGDYQRYDDRFLLPNETVMVNHATGKKTTMLWEDIKLKTAQNEEEFTPGALRRIR